MTCVWGYDVSTHVSGIMSDSGIMLVCGVMWLLENYFRCRSLHTHLCIFSANSVNSPASYRVHSSIWNKSDCLSTSLLTSQESTLHGVTSPTTGWSESYSASQHITSPTTGCSESYSTSQHVTSPTTGCSESGSTSRDITCPTTGWSESCSTPQHYSSGYYDSMNKTNK